MSPRSIAYIGLANFLGGSSYLVTAYALETFGAAELVLWRILLGSLLLLPVLLYRRPRLGVEDWLRTAAVGIFGYAAPLLIGTRGQELSTATKAALLVGIEPVSILLLSALLLGERLNRRGLFCILLGLSGATLIVLQGANPAARADAPDFFGDVLLFLHGLGWSLYTVIGKPVLRRVDPLTFTGLTTLFALGPMLLLAGPSLARSQPPAGAMAALIYLSLGVSILGCWAWNKAVQEAPASGIAAFIFLQPLIGVLLGVGLKGEFLTRWSAVGGLLILAGAYGAARKESGP